MPEPTEPAEFFRALHEADIAAVRRALDGDSSLADRTDAEACGTTALNIAVWRRSPELIDLLLEHGAEIGVVRAPAAG
jgi:hypothetical protein